MNGPGLLGAALLAACLVWLGITGPGVGGAGNAVSWAFTETAFRWWLGVAQGCVLVSAGLLLARVPWRRDVHRAASAAALAALACALACRPWLFTFWPLLTSPLAWSALAVWAFVLSTLCFAVIDLRLGLVWTGSSQYWQPWRAARGVLGALAMLSAALCATFTSFETALSVMPGWHGTLAPLRVLVLSALSALSVLALAVPARRDALNRLALGAALLLLLGAASDRFSTWYVGGALLPEDALGTYALLATCALPQLYWSDGARASAWLCAAVAASAWLEHFAGLAVAQQHGALPSTWSAVAPSLWDAGLLAGTLGLFALGLTQLARRVT